MPAAEAGTPGAPVAGEVLSLPANVDATAAAALYRQWAPRAAQLAVIDFSQVTSIDSTGVALVRALGADAQRAGAPAPRMQQVPPHYAQLCLAHRIDCERH